LVDNALSVAGTDAGKLTFTALSGAGVVYGGMEVLGSGAVLAGMVLGAVLAFIIDRQFAKAAIYAFGGAALSFFGFIHSTRLAWVANWQVAIGYAAMGCIFLVFAYVPAFQPEPEQEV